MDGAERGEIIISPSFISPGGNGNGDTNPVRDNFRPDALRYLVLSHQGSAFHPVTARDEQRVLRFHAVRRKEEIYELRRAHIDLLRRVTALSRRMDVTSAQVASGNALAAVQKAQGTEKCLQRTILFASINAAKALCTPHPELSRPVTNLCAGNTVAQVMLKSKASDCTLEDFRLFTRECCQSDVIGCMVLPSEFYAMFSDTSKCSRFDIVFDTYFFD